MEEKDYIRILIKQGELLTSEMKDAIEKQTELHRICEEKQIHYYQLEDKYRGLFVAGLDELFRKYPDLRYEIPVRDTRKEAMTEIAQAYIQKTGRFDGLAQAMKTIPKLVEASGMEVEIGKAYYEFFVALAELNTQIIRDRKHFFSAEYITKMDALADEGVMMYFLETPYYPLLEDGCDADFVLDSFIFNDYISTATLLKTFFETPLSGDSMQRKQEDLCAALSNMVDGFYRSAARTWFSLLESEHKKCADVMEGYWEKAREFKNGFQRSKKIYDLFDKDFDMEWERHAWEKIDTYYQKMVGKEVEGVVNRNVLIHGDYNNASIDITDRDVVKIMLMWLNLRLIADSFCYVQEMIENRMNLVPYFCSLPFES